MSLSSLAGPTDVGWFGQPPHEDLRRGRPLLPVDDPFYAPPPGYHHTAEFV